MTPSVSLDDFDGPETLAKWLDDVPAEELPAVQACLMAQADQRQQLHADRIGELMERLAHLWADRDR
ncbi:hypothetical protein [Nonomuraea sp. NPDC002799]